MIVAQQCSGLSEAIGKIDEAIDQIEQLNVTVKEQRTNLITVEQRCTAIHDEIQKCKSFVCLPF